jgi:pseudoazurin
MLFTFMRFKVLRLIPGATLILLLIACGDQAEPETEAPAPAVKTTPAEEVPALAAETDPKASAEVVPEPDAGPMAPADAETHTVNALATAFDPMVIFIEPGDSVSWVNMAGHDSRSLEGLIPEGAEHWATPLGQSATITLTEPGLYLYKCTPHYAMGMAGAVIVGDAHNLDEVDANATGMARRVLARVKQALENR